MKFSFLTYQFCRYPLEYCFKMGQHYGLDGVEVWGARPHAYAYDLDAGRVAEINGYKKKYGLEISMFTPEILAYPYNLASQEKKEYEETVAYLIRSVEAAAAIGTDKMQITTGHPGYKVDRHKTKAQVGEGIARLCKRAEELGVDIILESLSSYEGNTVTTAHQIGEMIEMVGSPALKSMVDVAVPVVMSEPVSEYFDTLGDKMEYLHLCNCPDKDDFHMPVHDANGIIPMKALFKVLERYHYDGWCSLEILGPYFRDPELYLAQFADDIEIICNEYGVKRQRGAAACTRKD